MGEGGGNVELIVGNGEHEALGGERHSDGRGSGRGALMGRARDGDHDPEQPPGLPEGGLGAGKYS